MTAKSLLIAASVAVGFASQGSAQGAGKVEMIPVDVAQDLMGAVSIMTGAMGMGGSRAIGLGKLGDDLQGKVYLPATTRVLASTSGFLGTTVLESSLSRDSTVATFRREMPRLGWKAVEDRMNQGWGFVPAPTAARDTVFSLCNATSSLMVSARSTATNVTRLILITIPQPAPECMPRSPGRPDMAAMRRESRMPTLINPPGSDRPGCGNSGGSGGNPSSGASIATTMSDEELLNHYGKQLADSGWTMGSPQPVSRTWVRTDSSGTRRALTIDVTPVPGSAGCRLLDMQVKFRYR